MKSTVEHVAEVEAEIGKDVSVTLYAADGEPIQVAADKADVWLARGFHRTPQDLDTLVAEVDALGDAVGAPWRAYVEACRTVGHIDEAAQDTAHESLRVFGAACNALHLAIHQ